MIYPIVVYGHPVLRKVAREIGPDYPGLREFLDNLWETMYASDGIGLAAPQVGNSIRIFVIDPSPLADEDPKLLGFKKAFINPVILERLGEHSRFNEGCLSIPNIREDVEREPRVRIQYYDEDFNLHDEYFDGIVSRIIQHEYDHLEGILFTDLLSPLKRRIMKGKLNDISRGKFEAAYQTILPKQKVPAFGN